MSAQLEASADLPLRKQTTGSNLTEGWMGSRTGLVAMEELGTPDFSLMQPVDQSLHRLSLCPTNYALHHEGISGSGCIDLRVLAAIVVSGE